jgi:hypothetical protein
VLIIPEGFMHSHNVGVVNLAHQLNLVERIRACRDLLFNDANIPLLLSFFAFLVSIFLIFLYLDDLDCTVSAGFPLNAVPDLPERPYTN